MVDKYLGGLQAVTLHEIAPAGHIAQSLSDALHSERRENQVIWLAGMNHQAQSKRRGVIALQLCSRNGLNALTLNPHLNVQPVAPY